MTAPVPWSVHLKVTSPVPVTPLQVGSRTGAEALTESELWTSVTNQAAANWASCDSARRRLATPVVLRPT